MAEADSWLWARPRLGVYQPCFPSHQPWGGGDSSTCTYTLMSMDARVDLRITNTAVAPPRVGSIWRELLVFDRITFCVWIVFIQQSERQRVSGRVRTCRFGRLAFGLVSQPKHTATPRPAPINQNNLRRFHSLLKTQNLTFDIFTLCYVTELTDQPQKTSSAVSVYYLQH